MKLQDALPPEFAQQYATFTGNGHEPAFCLKSDLDSAGRFGESYLAVDDQRVVAFDQHRQPIHLPLEEVKEVRVDELVGASRLVAVTEGGERALIRYSRNLVGEFALMSRVMNDLRQGKPAVLPEELESALCPKCGSPLPERGATCPMCLSRAGIFFRLLRLIRPYHARLAVVISTTILAVGCAMVPPLMIKQITDRVISQRYSEALPWLVGIMFVALVAEHALRFLSNWQTAWLGGRVVADMRATLHARLQMLRMSYHNRRESGQLVGRVMGDSGELQHFLIDGLPYFVVNVPQFLAIAILLFWLDWRLALPVFLPVPLLLLGSGWFWKRLHPLFHKIGNRRGRMHSVLSESLGGVRTVKSLVQENRRISEFNHVNEQAFDASKNMERMFSGFFSTMGIAMSLGTTLVWYFGARFILAEPTGTQAAADGQAKFELGTLLAFIGYIGMLYGPLQWFSAVFNWMTNAFAAAERIFAVLDQQPEMYENPKALPLPEKVQGRLDFEDVRFSYERGREIIKGLSFQVEPGQMLGLVGKSGSGKSTIINLVCRFYEPDSGRILVDGIELGQTRIDDWRRQVGIVMQEPFLFNASILDNIRYGKPDARFEEVVRAAKAAKAHEFICEKDEGYDTVIGEGGIRLSGGEKQRVAIARAILNDPPILILDEATSAVDSETEKHIQEAITNLTRNRTTIAIAHRLATLRNAHKLLVIEDGKIVEEGTHEDLMAREDGHFARLVRLQTENNKLRSEQAVWQ